MSDNIGRMTSQLDEAIQCIVVEAMAGKCPLEDWLITVRDFIKKISRKLPMYASFLAVYFLKHFNDLTDVDEGDDIECRQAICMSLLEPITNGLPKQ